MFGNIYAPFSLGFHVFFCIVATLFYVCMYNIKGYKHYIYLIFAIDLTLASQFFPYSKVMIALGIVELILLTLIFISMGKISMKNKKEEKERKRIKDSLMFKSDAKKKAVDDAFQDDDF